MRFTVPGEPAGKGRPRMTRAGHAYTPKETASYENLVKLEYQAQGGVRFGDGDMLRMDIHAFYSIPASDSKRKRKMKLEGAVRPTKKPDCDNVGKIIADALNGIAYRDDAQIVEMHIEKYYAGEPRVEVTIMEA